MQDKGEKTEEATPRRLKKARERGQVARSREVSSALVLGAALLYFYVLSYQFVLGLARNVKAGLQGADELTVFSVGRIQTVFGGVVSSFAALVLPFMLVIVVTVVVANLAQGGFILTSYPLKPKLDRLNPIRGFGRIFGSLRTLAETGTSSAKLFVVALIGYWTIKPELSNIPIMFNQSVSGTIAYLGAVAFKLLLRVFVFLLLLAIFDFFYRKYEHKKGLRMTKQEVKDEFKEIEGNPLIKSKIRQRQYQMARRRMMSEVPTADVVITNPTTLAVALRYEASEEPAPVVVAKGAGSIAERIISIAVDNDIPTVQNKPLARLLFNSVDVGELIPESLYKAVAEVLAYVYRLKSSAGARPKRTAAREDSARSEDESRHSSVA